MHPASAGGAVKGGLDGPAAGRDPGERQKSLECQAELTVYVCNGHLVSDAG